MLEASSYGEALFLSLSLSLRRPPDANKFVPMLPPFPAFCNIQRRQIYFRHNVKPAGVAGEAPARSCFPEFSSLHDPREIDRTRCAATERTLSATAITAGDPGGAVTSEIMISPPRRRETNDVLTAY